jgi:hypothetical protein
VPKEGDWLASVPQKSELIRPSRFIDAAKKGQNELLVEFWNDPEKAIEINKIDPIYQTALHWAARGGHLSTVKLLLSWGANPNFRDKTGETPLHKAAVGNYAACCSALLQAGASRDILNAQHLTAMDLTEDRNTRFALAPQALVEEEDQPFEQVHTTSHTQRQTLSFIRSLTFSRHRSFSGRCRQRLILVLRNQLKRRKHALLHHWCVSAVEPPGQKAVEKG